MINIQDIKQDMQEALDTKWDRDSAIRHGLEAIEQLERLLSSAVDDMKYVCENSAFSCELCANNITCDPDTCPHYMSGVGVVDKNGNEYPDLEWDCRDFDFGTCPALENTPCNGCDSTNNWKWRVFK